MSIQASINQTMSLAGLLFSQTPIAEEGRIEAQHKRRVKEAKRDINLAQAAENEALDTYVETVEKISKAGKEKGLSDAEIDNSIMETAEYAVYKEAMAAETKAHSRLAELEPTKKNISGMVSRRRAEMEQLEVEQKARQALAAEQSRISKSNQVTKSLDISKLDKRTLPRVERAYKRAERDTKYLTKNNQEA